MAALRSEAEARNQQSRMAASGQYLLFEKGLTVIAVINPSVQIQDN